MNNLSKNGGYLYETIPCQSVMEGVKTMSNVLTKDLSKLLYAFSMFDGCLIQQTETRNASLIVNMLEENKDYIDAVEATLIQLEIGCTVSRPEIYSKDGHNRKQQLRLHSAAHPIFTQMRARIYIDGRKVIDPHMLTMLDAEMLAIAFMADGSRCVDKRWENARPSYRLHLNNLSYGDLMLLKTAVKDKLEIEVNLRKKGDRYDLGIPTAQSSKFESIVAPFIFESFKYKLGR